MVFTVAQNVARPSVWTARSSARTQHTVAGRPTKTLTILGMLYACAPTATNRLLNTRKTGRRNVPNGSSKDARNASQENKGAGGQGDSHLFRGRLLTRPACCLAPERWGPLNLGVLHQHGGAVFRPNGAAGCSRGWSGAAAKRPDAEPVERSGFLILILFFSPGRGEGDSWADERKPVPGDSSAPSGRMCYITIPPTGCAPAAVQRPVLHPWPQSAAPLGRSVNFLRFQLIARNWAEMSASSLRIFRRLAW